LICAATALITVSSLLQAILRHCRRACFAAYATSAAAAPARSPRCDFLRAADAAAADFSPLFYAIFAATAAVIRRFSLITLFRR